jgi:hypothetical protein
VTSASRIAVGNDPSHQPVLRQLAARGFPGTRWRRSVGEVSTRSTYMSDSNARAPSEPDHDHSACRRMKPTTSAQVTGSFRLPRR